LEHRCASAGAWTRIHWHYAQARQIARLPWFSQNHLCCKGYRLPRCVEWRRQHRGGNWQILWSGPGASVVFLLDRSRLLFYSGCIERLNHSWGYPSPRTTRHLTTHVIALHFNSAPTLYPPTSHCPLFALPFLQPLRRHLGSKVATNVVTTFQVDGASHGGSRQWTRSRGIQFCFESRSGKVCPHTRWQGDWRRVAKISSGGNHVSKN
jgi:hypothetical protein